MPYILVEIVDEGGNKELIAAPETWLERDERDSQAFLCWPSVRNITTLNALLADASSTPLPGWEKHPCVIKCSNIQSPPSQAVPFLPGMAHSQVIKFSDPSVFFTGRATKPYG